jgi:hypothetical protein
MRPSARGLVITLCTDDVWELARGEARLLLFRFQFGPPVVEAFDCFLGDLDLLVGGPEFGGVPKVQACGTAESRQGNPHPIKPFKTLSARYFRNT